MTELEWRECDNLGQMLGWLDVSKVPLDRLRRRKARLFECACCRLVWEQLTDERSRAVVEAAELFADGHVEMRNLAAAASKANSARIKAWHGQKYVVHEDGTPIQCAAHAAEAAGQIESYGTPTFADTAFVAGMIARAVTDGDAPRIQRDILRDLVGPLPFRRLQAEPRWLAWNSGRVPALSEAIYEERAFDRLPILGDALEEAGCHDATILAHCRSGGEHVRGCWVLDLILSKDR